MRNRWLEHLYRRRPRILNLLHCIGLVEAISATHRIELNALARFAKGARLALEIGSDQGVSAAKIAESIHLNGLLYCIDPWPKGSYARNPQLAIFERHTGRRGVRGRIKILHGTSREVAVEVPTGLDFIFVDGDHTEAGIAFDWNLVKQKLSLGGLSVCMTYMCLTLNHGGVPNP